MARFDAMLPDLRGYYAFVVEDTPVRLASAINWLFFLSSCILIDESLIIFSIYCLLYV